MQVVGCASSTRPTDSHTDNVQLKRGTSTGTIRVNGREFDQAEPLPPGRHEIEVKVPWSNGLWEDIRFELNALPGRRYEIMRVELKPGKTRNIRVGFKTTGNL
jgi:hypothetical protein